MTNWPQTFSEDLRPSSQTHCRPAAVKTELQLWVTGSSTRRLRLKKNPTQQICVASNKNLWVVNPLRQTSRKLPTVLDNPAGGVDVQLEQVHHPLVLLSALHELGQSYLTWGTQKQQEVRGEQREDRVDQNFTLHVDPHSSPHSCQRVSFRRAGLLLVLTLCILFYYQLFTKIILKSIIWILFWLHLFLSSSNATFPEVRLRQLKQRVKVTEMFLWTRP